MMIYKAYTGHSQTLTLQVSPGHSDSSLKVV